MLNLIADVYLRDNIILANIKPDVLKSLKNLPVVIMNVILFLAIERVVPSMNQENLLIKYE